MFLGKVWGISFNLDFRQANYRFPLSPIMRDGLNAFVAILTTA